jgi:NADPH2:quinone reductase
MQKRILITGSTLRARSHQFKSELARAVEMNVLPLLLDGRFDVKIDRVFPLDEAVAAHTYLESGRHIGKLLLHM